MLVYVAYNVLLVLQLNMRRIVVDIKNTKCVVVLFARVCTQGNSLLHSCI